MPSPPTPRQTHPNRNTRVPVPGAIFVARPLPFLLFDDGGRTLTLDDDAVPESEPTVYLSPADLSGLRSYLRQHLHAIATSHTIDLTDRAWAIHRALLYETSEAFSNIHGRSSLAQLTAVAQEAALFQLTNRGVFPFLDLILSNAYTLVTHAVETALWATALAAVEGTGDADRLFSIALGGLLADVSKLELPAQMLMRDGPLTEEEWRLMHAHPQRSGAIMRQAGVVKAAVLGGVLSHHERWDGSGYPRALRGEEIPLEARCIAIADSYSAMTVDRAHQARLDPFDALSEMASSPDGHFDPALLRSFVLLMGSAREAEDFGAAQPAA